MLKRVTKVTSLLVVAASIVSMVPAMAADYKKIDAQDGTVYYGKAKGNGVFIVDGEINGKDDGTVYYVADGKYNELKNADSGADISGDIFQNKYVEFDGGDYYIDITTGDKTDESIADNWHDDIASTVRKNLKNDNDGRLADSNFNNIVAASGQPTNGNKPFMNGAMGNWSEFKYYLKNANTNGVTKTTIYSDPDGKYIDADYNLGIFNVATTGAAVAIKNTKDTYDIKYNNQDYVIKAQIDSSMALSEGYDYILRSANISIWGRLKTDPDVTASYSNMTSDFKFGSKSNNYDIAKGNSSVEVFQKISKAQSSDNVDGIKYAKDTSTYFKTDSEGKTQEIYRMISTNSAGILAVKSASKTLYAQEIKLKGENGFYYTDLSDSDSIDNDDANWTSGTNFNFGGGMLYCLANGYVQMWNNVDSFQKLYKVDGAMNKMSASNKDNIIVWNEDDGVYSVIANASNGKTAGANTGTNATDTTAAAVTTVSTTAGWVKAANGTWTYNKADGTKATGWFQDSTGTWYFAKAEGIMVANGWAQSGSTWYYLGETGAMATNQWVQSGKDWYYIGATGAMLTNTVQDGYKIGDSGAWIK